MAAVVKLLTFSAISGCARRPFAGPLTACRRPALASLRLCSTALTEAVPSVTHDDAVPSSTTSHPWPEWDRFIESLRSKGYFSQPLSPTGAAPAEDAAGGDDDLNKVKNACLKFGRERFDILRSLPRQDIQGIVENGCPNLFRKAINSAKRLRAFLQLDEASVCSACKLHESCDRAGKTAVDDSGARTVDVVRILLTYAIEPANLSVEDAVNEKLHESARKLLLNLIDLGNKDIDPSLPKPEFNSKASLKEGVERSKRSDRKSKRETEAVAPLKGDWLCPKCNFLNFARNLRCRECQTDGPKLIDHGIIEMKMGDWTCPGCQFMNFARNKKCFRCEEARPQRELNPGEWECPSCSYVNFRRNKVCKKCNLDHPADEANQFQYHEWRKPTPPASFNDGDDDTLQVLGEPQLDSERRLKETRFDRRDGLLLREDKHRSVKNDNFSEKDNQEDIGRDDFSSADRKKEYNARNRKMVREVPPRRELNPGEWECPSCSYLNFRQNKICRKCDHNRPERNAPRVSDQKKGERKFTLATEKSLHVEFVEDDSDGICSGEDDEKSLPLIGESKFVLRNKVKNRSLPRTANNLDFGSEDDNDGGDEYEDDYLPKNFAERDAVAG